MPGIDFTDASEHGVWLCPQKEKKKKRLIDIAVEWIPIRNIQPLKFYKMSSLSC